MSSDTVTIPLSHSLDLTGQSLSELTLRRPVCSDIEDLSWGDLYSQQSETYRILIPRICIDGIGAEDLDRLNISDLMELYTSVYLWFSMPFKQMNQSTGVSKDNKNIISYSLSASIEKDGGQNVEVVTLRKPKAADLNGISFGKIYRRLVSPYRTLIPRLTDDLGTDDLDLLHPFDLFELMAITFLFFHSPQDTGPRALTGITSAQ